MYYLSLDGLDDAIKKLLWTKRKGATIIDFEIPSWTAIEDSIMELARNILPLKEKLNAIICVWRGGAYPSRLLSDFLGIKTVYNIRVKYYDVIRKEREFPTILQAIQADLIGENVLVCDDVSDSGNSLTAVVEYLNQKQCNSITTATIYIKPWTNFIPDFYIKKTEKWIVFPWERIETIEDLTKNHLNEGKTLEEIERELLSAGFDQKQVKYYLSIRPKLKNR